MRIVALSDMHGYFPPRVPDGDLLLIAGDICPDRLVGRGAFPDPDGQESWMMNVFYPWLEKLPHRSKLCIWGNHDWVGQLNWPKEFPQDEIAYKGGLKIWCSPWSNQFQNWAFMREPGDLRARYASIPEGTDIILSHQPPFGLGDLTPRGERVGSRELLLAIHRVHPSLVICGHIHGGHGHHPYSINGRETDVYNVSLVNERYTLVNDPTVIDWTDRNSPGPAEGPDPDSCQPAPNGPKPETP